MIVRNGALMFSCDKPELVSAAIPKAKAFRYRGHNLVAVKHGLDETRVLRNLGLKAPSPILHDGYTWPGRLTPMDKQRETADFLTVNRRAFVLSEMGTGKTAATAWAADYLLTRGHVKRILIVSPVSVMNVWQQELFQVLPHRSVGLLTGRRERRLAVMEEGNTFDIINYDGVSSLFNKEYYPNGKVKSKHSALTGKYDLIIVDEAAAYRNGETDRYEALRFLLAMNTRLWLLTATPTPNAPTDAWALIRLVSPSRVPNSFKLFQEAVMRQAGPYKWVPREGAQTYVRELMQPAVRFTKEDCLDLPSITYNNRQCDLSGEQKSMFEEMRKKMRHEDEDAGISITAVNAAVKILKLQQICCGIVKDNDGNPVNLKPKNRLDTMLELVEQTEQKVIVFVPFIFSMHQVLKHLHDNGVTAELVNGNVSVSERSRIFHEFQNAPEPRVLVAHPAVAAHGLTLTAASAIIWYAPIYSIEQYEQANGRINRKGQAHPMSVYHVGAHPFEWRIYDVLRGKARMQDSLLAMYREVVGG